MSDIKPVRWIGAALDDLRGFPAEAQEYWECVYFAQKGDKHPSAKPLKGFGGAGVLEIVEDCEGDSYRAVYTIRLADVIYVLHAFKKKSKRGIKTPKHEIDLLKQRLQQAEEDYRSREHGKEGNVE